MKREDVRREEANNRALLCAIESKLDETKDWQEFDDTDRRQILHWKAEARRLRALLAD